MPTYEYKCDDCDKISSARRNINEYNQQGFCSYCGKLARKIVSLPAVHTQARNETELYPMVNYHIGKKVRQKDGSVKRVPVVFKSQSEKKEYYKRHGLIDAVTPEAEKPTMYVTDADGHQDDEPPERIARALEREQPQFFSSDPDWEPKTKTYNVVTGELIA